MPYEDFEYDRPATYGEAINEYATNAGSDDPESPWISRITKV
jgi:hypothetical protein